MYKQQAQWKGPLPLTFHRRDGRIRVRVQSSAGRPEGRDNPAKWAPKAQREHPYKDHLRTERRLKLGKAERKKQKKARHRARASTMKAGE